MGRKLNIGKARRRVQIRSALLLTLGVFAAMTLLRLAQPALPAGLRMLFEMLLTLLAFGGGAYLGLCVLDGDHRRIVPVRRLSRAQTLWLALLGACAVCPMALAADLIDALFGVQDVVSDSQALAASAALIVRSVLIAPICEELFFRGYLLHALERAGRLRAVVVVSLCFALAHAGGAGVMAAHVLFSALLCLLTMKTGSLLAPVIVHACYNLTLIVLSGAGLSGLVTGWGLIACIVKLAGCAAFFAVLRRAFTARTESGTFALWEGGRLTRREIALLAAAGAALLLSIIVGG